MHLGRSLLLRLQLPILLHHSFSPAQCQLLLAAKIQVFAIRGEQKAQMNTNVAKVDSNVAVANIDAGLWLGDKVSEANHAVE